MSQQRQSRSGDSSKRRRGSQPATRAAAASPRRATRTYVWVNDDEGAEADRLLSLWEPLEGTEDASFQMDRDGRVQPNDDVAFKAYSRRCWELRQEGASEYEIEEELSLQSGQVKLLLNQWEEVWGPGERYAAEAAELSRERMLELARLDIATRVLIDIFKDGDVEQRIKAVRAYVQLSTQRCKILGLFAAKRIEVNSDISFGDVDAEWRTLTEQLGLGGTGE
jgi:hypothetical protein